ncbi:MAG: hypothetical protein AB7S38_35265 [Vulcanimicrobiota bacterium]
MNWLAQLGIFILVLAALKYLLGLPISIVGSLVLTVLLTLVFAGISSFSRRDT